MATNYTTKTAALKATKADINKLDAKKMLLNGKNIEELWGLNFPQDYPKLITRTQLSEDDNYVLYDDYGNLLFMNFSDKIVNGSDMFRLKNITSFNYDLPNLTNGERMFLGCSNLTSFNCNNLSSLTNGIRMFDDCTNLESFNCNNLSSLTDGSNMFESCTNLTSFNSDLSNLTNGNLMFYWCTNLISFNCNNLPSLDIGRHMFERCPFTSFSSKLSSVTDGYLMFAGCTNLESFSSNLSNLTDGGYMFNGCTALTSFNADLSSLTNGEGMFCSCNLDDASIENIFSSIPTQSAGNYKLHVEVQQSGADKIHLLTGYYPATQSWQTVDYKGWQISYKLKS